MAFFFPLWCSLHHKLYTKQLLLASIHFVYLWDFPSTNLLLVFWIIQHSVFSIIFSPLVFPLYSFFNKFSNSFTKHIFFGHIMIARYNIQVNGNIIGLNFGILCEHVLVRKRTYLALGNGSVLKGFLNLRGVYVSTS